MSKALKITVSHEDLPASLTMVIDHGNGFDDNARRLGWQAEIGPSQAEIEAAQLAVLQAPSGSSERLAAQKALQVLQATKRPNPMSSLEFLIKHVRNYIESILIDQEDLEQQRQAALEKIAADAMAALAARVTIE